MQQIIINTATDGSNIGGIFKSNITGEVFLGRYRTSGNIGTQFYKSYPNEKIICDYSLERPNGRELDYDEIKRKRDELENNYTYIGVRIIIRGNCIEIILKINFLNVSAFL